MSKAQAYLEGYRTFQTQKSNSMLICTEFTLRTAPDANHT